MTAVLPAWSRLTRQSSVLRSFLKPQQPQPFTLPFLYPWHQTRGAKTSKSTQSTAQKAKRERDARRKKKHKTYKTGDLKDAVQFSLCDAMRYIRAVEVGRPPKVPKYELHIHLKTVRNGPVVRGQMRLPHAVKTNVKICVVCPPDSNAARDARAAGATLVGEDEVFEAIKSGKIDFDRCIAQPRSLPKINQAGLGRVLGPKGLMPSPKLGTVVENVGQAVSDMLGGIMYRERRGVVQMAIGQLGFTPEEVRDNIQAFVGQVKKEAADLSDQVTKEVHEVVLSSTNSPGFSLNGEFRSENSPSVQELST